MTAATLRITVAFPDHAVAAMTGMALAGQRV